MGKGFLFVVAFSCCTIVLFCVLVYLMGNINPPPLADDGGNLPNKKPVNATRRFNSVDNQIDYLYTDEYEFETYRGLKKAKKAQDPDIKIDTKDVLNPKVTKSTTKVHVTREEGISATTFKHGKNRAELRPVHNYVNKTIGSAFSVKGHRRSADINNLERNVYVPDSGTLVLKILDEQGDARVEIKLNPININRSYGKRLNSSLFDTRNDFYNNIIFNEGNYFSNETKIIIMPNNTVVYDDNVGNQSNNKHFTVEKNNKTLIQLNITNTTEHSLLKHLNNVTEKIKTLNNTTYKYYDNKKIKKLNDTKAKLNKTHSSQNNTDLLPLKFVFNNETKLFTTPQKLSPGKTDLNKRWVGTVRNSTKSRY